MIIARELVDELKKIKDFDITYKSDDNNSGEIYIDYNGMIFALEYFIWEGKFCLSGMLHSITYRGKHIMRNIFGKKEVRSFAEQLAEVKNIFKTSYDQAIALNAAIAEDIKVKQNEIASIQTQIDFNSQVAEDNSKYIAKLKELIS